MPKDFFGSLFECYDMAMTDKYKARINYEGALEPKLAEVASEFQLGDYQSHDIIPIGYEDLNLKLETGNGTYFVKVFAASRTQDDIDRYVGIIEAVLEAGVKHPKLLATGTGQRLFQPKDTPIQLLVMEWLNGGSYWDLGEKPTRQERSDIILAASRLNTLTYQPSFGYDSWAINNLSNEYKNNSQYLNAEDREVVSSVLHDFEAIDHKSLPHGLVHGDLISTNVMRTSRGIYFIDFAVANYLPRIQELAILLCDLMFDETEISNAKALYEETVQEYQKHVPLDQSELAALPVYVRAAHAMHIVPPSKFIAKGEDNGENRHWLSLGRAGISSSIYGKRQL